MKITSINSHGTITGFNKGCRCPECADMGLVYDLVKAYPAIMDHIPEKGWEKDSHCRGMDPELFLCNDDQAISRCNGCSVRQDCLSFSFQARPRPAGTYGGVSEKNRERVLRLYQKTIRDQVGATG